MQRILTVLLVVLMTGMAFAHAQDETEPLTFEIEGMVTITDDGSVMIGDVVLIPADNAEDMTFEEGQYIVIVGELVEENVIVIAEFEVTEEPSSDEEELLFVHPVGDAIATQFELDYETVEGWNEDGLGYGEIARSLLLADQVEGLSFEDTIQMVQDGENLSQIARENGLSPSALAPGQIISGRYTSPTADDIAMDGFISSGVTVNIRVGPGTTNDIVGTLQPGDTFTIIGEEDGWYLIELADGTQVYVFADLVTEGNVPEGFETTVVGTSSNQGQVQEGQVNKFGCEGRGNSCNTPAENNRNNGNGGGRGNGKNK